MDFNSDSWKSLPEHWRRQLADQLGQDESLIGWFETDLDLSLHYATGLVALTDRRLLSIGAATEPRTIASNSAAPTTNGQAAPWQSWPIVADVQMRAAEEGGLGTLELVSATGRLAYWRYTTAKRAQARRLETQWGQAQARLTKSSIDEFSMPTVCPSCGAIITSSDGICADCAPAPPPPPVSSLFRLFIFAKSRQWMMMLGLALTVAGNFVGLMTIYLTGPLIDNVLVPWQEGRIVTGHPAWLYLVGMLGASLTAWLLNWARLYVTSCVSERIASDLRTKTYSHLQQLSLEFFGGKRTGDLMSRISSDTDRICIFLSVSLVDFVNDVVMILITAGLLLWKDARLAVCTLTTFPIIVWLVYGVRRRLRHGFDQSIVAAAHLNSVLADTIPGIRVVKAFAQEHREIERFNRANRHLVSINDRVNVIWSFFGPLVTLLTDVGLLGVWIFGVWLVFSTPSGAATVLQVGTLVVFAGLMNKFFGRMESMLRIVYATQRAAASSHRIFEILDRTPSVPEPTKPVHIGRLEGRIEMHGVRFKYGTREVLHGIDLTIEPGEMIGLVGPTGAGKSTLINLICRFFDVAEGSILVDGVDIRSYPVAEYRKHIGIVLQDPFLFYGTIAENIAYGKPDASQAEIIAAARAARAHEFILQLPDGYDSLVGERGQSLSGGERQRISIARALLIDPRILILDEATSAVDTETEREIQIALDNLIRGRTTLAIAHRLSTLRKANRLVVVERGQIAEIGKHADLLDDDGPYARLHKAQMELVHGVGA